MPKECTLSFEFITDQPFLEAFLERNAYDYFQEFNFHLKSVNENVAISLQKWKLAFFSL